MLAVAALLSGACAKDEKVVGPTGPGAKPALSVATTSQFLPYGVPVPSTAVLHAEPEPYDPVKHGPFAKNTQPEENLVGRAGVVIPKSKLGPGFRSRLGSAAPPPATGDQNDSWTGYFVTGGRGIYARFDLANPPQVTAANPPLEWVAYTPTAIPYGYSCMEITGVHVGNHIGANLPYNDGFGVWDWCNQIKFVYMANTSPYSFHDPYVRTYVDEQGQTKTAYWVQVYEHNPSLPLHSWDGWSALIYNFNTGNWEEKWTSYGVSSSQLPGPNGWVMHETKNLAGTYNGTCYAQKSVAAANIMAYLWDPSSGSASWYPIDALNFDGSPLHANMALGAQACWMSGTWTLFTSYNEWRAITPLWTW